MRIADEGPEGIIVEPVHLLLDAETHELLQTFIVHHVHASQSIGQSVGQSVVRSSGCSVTKLVGVRPMRPTTIY